MASSTLSYDPRRHFDVRTEELQYRHDGEQSWAALIYRPQGPGTVPRTARHPRRRLE